MQTGGAVGWGRVIWNRTAYSDDFDEFWVDDIHVNSTVMVALGEIIVRALNRMKGAD